MSAAYSLARAAGGHLIHAVVTGTSLCGHTPTSKVSHYMRSRARWFYRLHGPVTCKKCLAKITQNEGNKS